MDEREVARVEERLPAAARVYLSVWSMGITPEGRQMRVVSAARLAGVSVSTVKQWRIRIPGFRELEAEARAYDSNYTQRLARRIVEGLVVPAGGVLAKAIEDGDVGLAWNIVKAAGGIAAVVELGGQERLAKVMEELRGLEDEEVRE